MNQTVLVTGGAGYIGSHTTLALLQTGFEVVVLDNLCNSRKESLNNVFEICGRRPVFIEGDILNGATLDSIFESHRISAVFHFAGLKAVGESAVLPLKYYETNVAGTIELIRSMERHEVFSLVFSSSATVYGDSKTMPLREDAIDGRPSSPYGRSKSMVEAILQDLSETSDQWKIAILRYFNPIGAHESGLIGEHPDGPPNNLLPFLSQVASGLRPELMVFGDDHETRDGTGIRDYIHVADLADGHLKALNAISESPGLKIWNLGTGRGYSVLEVISAFEAATQVKVPYRIIGRRPGDVAECWSDPSKAEQELDWKARRSLTDMMRDTWRWQCNYPTGYVN
jgi:UDP-glucose 4-epimerase